MDDDRCASEASETERLRLTDAGALVERIDEVSLASIDRPASAVAPVPDTRNCR